MNRYNIICITCNVNIAMVTIINNNNVQLCIYYLVCCYPTLTYVYIHY